MDEEMCHLFESADFCEVEDVIAAVVQVVPAATDGAECGVAGGHA
jgi:hypothetical protein